MSILVYEEADVTGSVAPDDLVLSDWSSVDSQMSVTAAVKIGLPPAAVDMGLQSRVVLREIRRSGEVDVAGVRELWGVAIRLSVVVQGVKIDSRLTLPIIAAHAQLGTLSAQATITVAGFDDDRILALLPNFAEMNTETYSAYTSATDAIKRHIAKHPENLTPKRLGIVLSPRNVDEDLRTAAVQASAVRSIADGYTLERFYQRNRDLDADGRSIAHDVWRELTDGQGTDDYPSLTATARAQAILEPLR